MRLYLRPNQGRLSSCLGRKLEDIDSRVTPEAWNGVLL
jgi:hypothetical protein